MNINGTIYLTLRLKNGKKLRLWSRNPEGLKWAMAKLFPKNEII